MPAIDKLKWDNFNEQLITKEEFDEIKQTPSVTVLKLDDAGAFSIIRGGDFATIRISDYDKHINIVCTISFNDIL